MSMSKEQNNAALEAERVAFEIDFDKRTGCNNGVAYYMNIDGRYCFDDIQNQWEAWQARAQ